MYYVAYHDMNSRIAWYQTSWITKVSFITNLKCNVFIQMKRVIEIPISNDMVPEKDECFEVELSEPSGGAVLGSITKLAVTITNDEGKKLSIMFANFLLIYSKICLYLYRVQFGIEPLSRYDYCECGFDGSTPQYLDQSDQRCK